MPVCKFCQKPFAWGLNEGKFVPLVPIGEEGEQPRTYQDENGVLRAEHRAICLNAGGPTVRVSRLARSIEAKDILPRFVDNPQTQVAATETVGQTIDRIRSRKRKKAP